MIFTKYNVPVKIIARDISDKTLVRIQAVHDKFWIRLRSITELRADNKEEIIVALDTAPVSDIRYDDEKMLGLQPDRPRQTEPPSLPEKESPVTFKPQSLNRKAK